MVHSLTVNPCYSESGHKAFCFTHKAPHLFSRSLTYNARWQINTSVLPIKPGTHLHVYPFTSSIHSPWLWHGELSHSSTSISQLYPSKPGTHWQAYESIPSRHKALFSHGQLEHSSIFSSQWSPVNRDWLTFCTGLWNALHSRKGLKTPKSVLLYCSSAV